MAKTTNTTSGNGENGEEKKTRGARGKAKGDAGVEGTVGTPAGTVGEALDSALEAVVASADETGTTSVRVFDRADALAELMQRKTASRPKLGDIFVWEIPSITVPVVAVAEMTERVGLGSLALPPVRINAAIQRTLAEMARRGLIREIIEETLGGLDEAEDDGGSNIVARAPRVAKSTDSAERVVYVLQRGWADTDADDVSWETNTKITYYKQAEKDAPELDIVGPRKQEAEELIARYRASYVARDLTEHVFKELIRAELGFSLRSRGGVYFVPATGEDTVSRMRAFIEELAAYTNRRCQLRLFPMLNDPDARADLAETAKTALEANVRELAINLRDWLADNERSGRKLRGNTLKAFRDAVTEITIKVQFYAVVTGMANEKLESACAELLQGATLLEAQAATENEAQEVLRREERTERSNTIASLAATGLEALDMTREERAEIAAAQPVSAADLLREERDI